MTIAEIRRIARRNLGRRVVIELRSGLFAEGIIVFAGISSLVLRSRVGRRRFVRTRIFYRNIISIDPVF
ncbi:hypothetical protein [Paenibacillus sp.]|jgi:hypothetical protein|uniref:hypothetical protein n=1 Tax=Paenibacillus sp. TaxID=58172 RepID=UPI00282F6028|nr:hypothetical protein [Paenibacillus sp.]MDR0267963.1 hypothetical protein [Paenibacillus sp.]